MKTRFGAETPPKAPPGHTINEIRNVYEVPESLQQQWVARSCHGDVQNNARAVINRFPGQYDGNPVNPVPLSLRDSAPLCVEMMGQASFDEPIATGKAKFEGSRTGFDQLCANLVPFTPDFEILPGTVPARRTDLSKPFGIREPVNPWSATDPTHGPAFVIG